MINKTSDDRKESPVDIFGEKVFSMKTMRNYLSERAYKSLSEAIDAGKPIDNAIADEVADAMKTWALEKGATHFCHWFQPLTGLTAEKHESFITPDREGGVMHHFSGKELIKGEPDASSFPSGGLRVTFEARGYTAWDPTSPAFIKETEKGSVLCIPTIFCGYYGDSLDKKTPLLKSIAALSKQVMRLAKLFGDKVDSKKAYTTLGAEQEYFLIDKSYYESRLDILLTGRTLFGRLPAKHQQMEDHYFGAIKNRVLNFMCDLDRELWRMGIPSKTRHNEVSPSQFEMAPVFEELNLAVDHNMLAMEIMRDIADKHGFACLLHEKPYAGVNGSGKHNNWAVAGPDGKNWLSPGENPHENAKFLTIISALMYAVDTHADLLRAAVASASNDHRLGANEAPPAIISIFLGDQLTDVIEQIEKGTPRSSKNGGTIELGVSSLPPLPRDATDRNRTSPLAFTGNKFEFRAVGSSQSCAGANIVLNTIVAESLDIICTKLEADIKAKRDFNESLQKILQDIAKKHKRILFNGDNYTEAWRKEAEKRGLPHLRKTPEALKALTSAKSIGLFTKYGVLSERELHSRYDVYKHAYEKTIQIESECAVSIVRTMIIPAVTKTQGKLAESLKDSESASGVKMPGTKAVLADICRKSELMIKKLEILEGCIEKGDSLKILDAMSGLRETVDELEGMVSAEYWPLPTYAEMLFMI